MADRPAHRRRGAPGESTEAPTGAPIDGPAGVPAPDATPDGPPPPTSSKPSHLPPDVRTGVRTVTLRVNRLANGGSYAWLAVVVIIFLFGAYRLAASGPLSGVVIIALAVVLAIWPVRRLGPGRLLTMEVTPSRVRLVTSFQAPVVVERSASLRVVLWVNRRYAGGEPRLRGCYLIEGDAVVASARPATLTTERLQRFCGNVAVPVELVDAERDPFAAAA